MEPVEWNESYSVGNALMDAHHQVFFRMIREFSESPDPASRDAMKQRIAFLAEYIAMHLAAEEALMRAAGYPETERHKAMHEAFAQQVMAVKEAFMGGQASLAADEVLNMMRTWFVDHILGEDKKYAPYLKPSD